MLKLFRMFQLDEAIAWAKEGQEALHVYRPGQLRPSRLDAFNNSATWGHLFCQDREALIIAARHFGVQRIVIHHQGTDRQHVDLCGKPLELAIRMAKMVAKESVDD